MKILVKVSGSISAYKICDLVSKLKQEGHELRVAMSESAQNFVGASSFEGLTGQTVFTEDFKAGERMSHIYLNDWADLVILAPASAQTLNSLSSGVGQSVLTTLFLARKKETPYLIFPAMNPRMWGADSVQKSVENLSKIEGVQIFAPAEGLMACGHRGLGRLDEVSNILDEVLKYDEKPLKALVTFGGTREDLDGVRFVTNFSSGATGVQICKALKAKFNVTALGSRVAFKESGLFGVKRLEFSSSENLADILYKEISTKSYDLIVHMAAVSDFTPEAKGDKKISSEDDFNIEWKKAPKILNRIREFSKNKKAKIVSFKLTHNQEEADVAQKILNQFSKSASDFVVHNELSFIDGEKHPYTIWQKDVSKPFRYGGTKPQMALDLLNIGVN